MRVRLHYKSEFNPISEIIIKESIIQLIRNYQSDIFQNTPVDDEIDLYCDLVALDRIGGEFGFGGARVFVAQILFTNEENNELNRSKLLLLKVVENNIKKSKDLYYELTSYNEIHTFFGDTEKYIAKPLIVYPPEDNKEMNSLLLGINNELSTTEPYIGKYLCDFYKIIIDNYSSEPFARAFSRIEKVLQVPNFNQLKVIGKKFYGELAKLSELIALKPLDLSERWNTSVLWSIFIDEEQSNSLPQQSFTELKDILIDQDIKTITISDRIDAAYRILSHIHNECEIEETILYDDLYGYLRKPDKWKNYLINMIGENNTFFINNKEYVNPLYILSIIEKRKELTRFNVRKGPIHGDLHPRNILIGKLSQAYIIDFGWANKCMPTVIDFVLMETSLKFFYFDWGCANFNDLIKYENYHLRPQHNIFNEPLRNDYIFDTPNNDINDENIKRLGTLISIIRYKAQLISLGDYENEEDSFFQQYLLPLFFVTLGNFNFVRKKALNLDYLLLSSGILSTIIQEKLNLKKSNNTD